MQLIPLMARVLAHTQVHRPSCTLRAAYSPWDLIYDELRLHGWATPEEFEEALHKRLSEKDA